MRLAWRLVKLELDLYVALGRWVLRRPAVPGGATAWGYSRMAAPVIWLWIFASAAEVPLVHILVPWETVRLVLLVLSVWGLAWMLGYLASLRVYPHLTDDNGLRVRNGKRADVHVPWALVKSGSRADRDLPSTIRTWQPLETPTGTDLQIGVSGRANVHVVLKEPLTVPWPNGELTVTALTFLVDDPADFVRAVTARLSPSRISAS